jgi:hypothetical protein
VARGSRFQRGDRDDVRTPISVPCSRNSWNQLSDKLGGARVEALGNKILNRTVQAELALLDDTTRESPP